MLEEFTENREHFLNAAREDLEKWCQNPSKRVGRRHTDQYWIEKFHNSNNPLLENEIHAFFSTFQLTRWMKWDLPKATHAINAFRKSNADDLNNKINELSDTLGNCLLYRDGQIRPATQQTSAATKLANFIFPQSEVFIWDQLANRAARLREARLKNSRIPSLRNPRHYLDHNGKHCYASYAAVCAASLNEERTQEDFLAELGKIRTYLADEGGPMATLKGDFVERRFLDKLMFQEGLWIRSYYDSDENTQEQN